MAKNLIGNIYELETSKGKVYLHFVHFDDLMGDLVRVLPGFYETRPSNIEEIVRQDEQFVLFFQVTYGSRVKLVKKVSKVLLEGYVPPRYMRNKSVRPGKDNEWFIVDLLKRERKYVLTLSKEEIKLSPYAIWSYPLLVAKLENGFSLDSWI